MFVGIVTREFAGRNEPKILVGPYDTREQAETEVIKAMQFPRERLFVLEAQEVLPDLIPCEDCNSEGYIHISLNRKENRQTKVICATCKGQGKLPRTLIPVLV